MKLKYLKEDLRFLKALWSPFKPFGLKLYAGKIAVGTPYFFPRKWINVTYKEAIEAATEEKKKDYYKKPFNEWLEICKKRKKAVPRKFGFDFVRLGWKTKWSEDDYRFEWTPRLSFVFFKWQIVVMVKAPEQDQYWEAWLYYEYATDKTKSKRERIEQCRKEHNQTWTVAGGEIDYYEFILKPKYLK